GRLPRGRGPTAQRGGLDRINTADLPYLRAGRTDPPRNVFRPSRSGGAFRGLEEWLTERHGAQRPLARIVEPEYLASEAAAAAAASRRREAGATDDRAYVTGFRLRAKRTPTTEPRSGNGTSSSRADEPRAAGNGASLPSDPHQPPRRRGVGPNGGMAVLWHGAEQGPEDRPPITILRAGDDAQGGFVLQLPAGSPPRPPTAPPLPLGLHANEAGRVDTEATTTAPAAAAAAAARDEPRSPDLIADPVDSAAEGFFPIKPPARPLSWDVPDLTTATDEHGVLLAHSLEGYWIGPYSSHGLEVLNLTTGLAEFPSSAASSSSASRRRSSRRTWAPSSSESDDQNDESSGSSSSSDSEDDGVTYRRVITATKVTGDPNVPSGQTSWIAILPAAPMSTHLANLADGPVPSVDADSFHHWSALDPSLPAYRNLNNGAGPDWTEGCVRAYGRIALTGYTSPSYSPAEVRLLRHRTKLRNPEQPDEARTVETIEEIHVRWLEMHKVTVFKRMRI
ncbi:hypothetical protein JCM3774_002113, partial [Rhodotorula dairenensis]